MDQFSKQDFKAGTIQFFLKGVQNASYSIVCAHQGINSVIDFQIVFSDMRHVPEISQTNVQNLIR